MKIGKYYILILIIIHSISLKGQSDSIFIFHHPKNGCLFQIQAKSKMTLYSISREYRASVEDIKSINNLNSSNLAQGQKLFIPVQSFLITQEKNNKANLTPIYYRTTTDETIFHFITKKAHLNWKASLNLNPAARFHQLDNQKQILVGYLLKDIDSTSNTIATESQNESDTIPELEIEEKIHPYSTLSYRHFERGLGIWEKRVKDFGSHYALHNKAKLNSIIEITNPVLGTTVYAKVIGRIPRTYPGNCQIVVSTRSAYDLGLASKRFFAQMRYQ